MRATLCLTFDGTCGPHQWLVWFDGAEFCLIDADGKEHWHLPEDVLDVVLAPVERLLRESWWDVEFAMSMCLGDECLDAACLRGSPHGWQPWGPSAGPQTWSWPLVRALIVRCLIDLIELTSAQRKAVA